MTEQPKLGVAFYYTFLNAYTVVTLNYYSAMAIIRAYGSNSYNYVGFYKPVSGTVYPRS